MIPKMKLTAEGNKIKPFIILALSFISLLTFGQNAIDYFPVQEGCVWKYDVYTLDNSNNIIAGSKSERFDSLIGTGTYKGKNASVCLTNWDLYNNVIGTGYNDSVTYSFSGPITSEYNYLFTPPYKGEFVDLIVAEIRDKIIGWFDLYQFDKPVNFEYEVFRYDTSIIYHVFGRDVNADITTKIIGKRDADEVVETSFGSFPSKKFTYNIVIDLIIYLQGNTYRVPFANFPVTHWITDNYWIIKEYRPTVTTSDLSQILINPVTVPGLSRIITGFNNPKPDTPILLAPQNNITDVSTNQSFSWNESNYANTYSFQLATDSNFVNIVFEDSSINSTSVTINNLANGTNFYWRVKAKNSSEVSEWSDFWKFTTEIEDFLTVSSSNLNIATTESSISTFTVTSNVNWTASSNQLWLKTNPSTGTGNGSVTLTAAANSALSERVATITVSAAGVDPKMVIVTQAAGAATLTVSPTSLNIGAGDGSTASFSINSNTTWNVSSDQTWLSKSTSNGIGNGSVTLTAQSNTSITSRSATLTVTATGAAAKTITVTQAAGDATLSVSSTSLIIAANEGSTSTLTITSNTSWTVSSNQTWVTPNQTTGSGNATITFTAHNNPEVEQRIATITVSSLGITTKTVTITQSEGSVILTLSTYSLTLDAVEGSSATTTITSNTSWNVAFSCGWLNITPLSGTGNSPISISAETNNTTSDRSDSVIFTSAEGVTRILSVNQDAGAATVFVSETNLTIGGKAKSTTTFKISSNTIWSITSSQNWASVSPESGTGDDSITVVADANTSSNERTALLTISAAGTDPKTVSVTQEAITGFEMVIDPDVIVYPNPFTDGFFVKSTSGVLKVTIFDMKGVKIFSGIISNNGFIPASKLKNGIYLVNVISNGNSIKKTVIKK
jgi:hypothetical protein